jgi:protein-disulfide isomerase
VAGQCANDQNKFWEYHDGIFADQSKLEVADLKALAAKLSLDTKTFDECLDKDKHIETIRKDTLEGNSLGVTGTPAFFINGRPLSGAQPASQFEEIIDDELSRTAHK